MRFVAGEEKETSADHRGTDEESAEKEESNRDAAYGASRRERKRGLGIRGFKKTSKGEWLRASAERAFRDGKPQSA